MYMKQLYERFLRFSKNPDLSPGQQAEYLRMAEKVKHYTTLHDGYEPKEGEDQHEQADQKQRV